MENDVKKKRTNDDDNNKLIVPYIVHESECARNERHIKRLIIALIICVALIFASNIVWLIAWMQYDYSDYGEDTDTVIELDGNSGGNANYIGNDGDINNGVDKGYQKNTEKN